MSIFIRYEKGIFIDHNNIVIHYLHILKYSFSVLKNCIQINNVQHRPLKVFVCLLLLQTNENLLDVRFELTTSCVPAWRSNHLGHGAKRFPKQKISEVLKLCRCYNLTDLELFLAIIIKIHTVKWGV